MRILKLRKFVAVFACAGLFSALSFANLLYPYMCSPILKKTTDTRIAYVRQYRCQVGTQIYKTAQHIYDIVPGANELTESWQGHTQQFFCDTSGIWQPKWAGHSAYWRCAYPPVESSAP